MDMVFRKTELDTLEPPSAVAAVRRIGDGFKAFQALRAAYGAGLFDWLQRNGPAQKAAIGAALDLRGAHLGAFLQTLEDLGLLARQDGAYVLAPGMDAVLCATSPWCQAQAVHALTRSDNGWSDLQLFLSEGWKSAARAMPQPLTTHPFLDEARRLVSHLATRPSWGGDPAAARTLLCFDGGDGLLAAALCQRHPGLRATVVVAPEAQRHAEEVIAACGVSARCRVTTGTPLDAPAGETFDHVVLFHSLYPVRRVTTDALRAASGCLAPGGELCCAHWFCLEACETAPGGLRDLDKAVLTDSHPMCHVEGYCARLEGIGLIDAERDDLAGIHGNTKLHFARQPGAR
jgi:hypothetical protein